MGQVERVNVCNHQQTMSRRVISGGGQMRAPGPWPQNPATIGNSTYTLQIVRRGRVTGHYHIYERRRPRSAISPLFVEPVHLVYCRRHLLPRDIASLTSLHCSGHLSQSARTVTPVIVLTDFSFGGSKIAFLFYPEYITYLSLVLIQKIYCSLL